MLKSLCGLSLFAMGRDVGSVVNQMQVALNRLSLWLIVVGFSCESSYVKSNVLYRENG